MDSPAHMVPLPREKYVVIGASAVVVILSYAMLLAAHGGGHGHAAAGHGMGHGLAPLPAGRAEGTLLFLFPMWTVMMVAMMLPPVLPWIWFYAAATREGVSGRVGWGRVAVFSSGYFAVWTVFSLFAALAQVFLAEKGFMAGKDHRLAWGAAAGSVLALAGFYQFSSLKAACLRHCRSPLTYFISNWREGPSGAFSMGARHGFFCLACCWALMLVSFAVGVMNYAWMALLTVFLAVEKTAPGGDRIGRYSGFFFIAWGAWVFLAGVPW